MAGGTGVDPISAGLNIIGSFLAYKDAAAKAKAERAIQKYRNEMSNLSAAIAQNSITTNETMSSVASAKSALEIKKAAIMSQGAAAVAAGAAGASGRSVNMTMRDLLQTSANAESERQSQLTDMYAAADRSRISTAMTASLQQDHSYIPKPNAASYMLQAAAKTYQSSRASDTPSMPSADYYSGLQNVSANARYNVFNTNTGKWATYGK